MILGLTHSKIRKGPLFVFPEQQKPSEKGSPLHEGIQPLNFNAQNTKKGLGATGLLNKSGKKRIDEKTGQSIPKFREFGGAEPCKNIHD